MRSEVKGRFRLSSGWEEEGDYASGADIIGGVLQHKRVDRGMERIL